MNMRTTGKQDSTITKIVGTIIMIAFIGLILMCGVLASIPAGAQ